jgi:hypothetical protein
MEMFQTKTLGNILKTFTKVQDQLNVFISKSHDQINRNSEKIYALDAENSMHRKDLDKAVLVQMQIKKLLGD